MEIIEKGMIFNSGTDTAAFTIPSSNGQIMCTRLGWDSPATGTLVIYRGTYRAPANAAVTADATLVIKTDSTGKVTGYTPTTDDYVLVANSTDNGTEWVLQKISSVAAVASSTISLGLAGNVTCLEKDAVFIVSASSNDIITLTTANESVREIYSAFVSRKVMPVHLLLTASGTCRINGMYEIQV